MKKLLTFLLPVMLLSIGFIRTCGIRTACVGAASLLCYEASAQFTSQFSNTADSTWNTYITIPGQLPNTTFDRPFTVKRMDWTHCRTEGFYVDSLAGDDDASISGGLVWVAANGKFHASAQGRLVINQSQIPGLQTAMQSMLSNQDTGVGKSIMTTAVATGMVSGKVDKTTTITINGVPFDLSANRVWNVGTLTGADTAWLSARINAKGSGTVTSVTSTDNSTLTVATGTTTPALTVVSAPKLQTPRNINGVAFDGTQNITIPPALGAPSYNNSITSGTAFQPDANAAVFVVVSGSLAGSLVGVYGTTIIAMSATQLGTYTNIGPGVSYFLNTLSVNDNRDSATIPVPKGYWLRVTNTAVGVGASVVTTYTKTPLQ